MLTNLKSQLLLKKELYLSVRVRPNSAKTELIDLLEDQTLKVSLAAVPEKGKANRELIKFLVKEFKVLKEQIKVISGAGERIKLIKISLK